MRRQYGYENSKYVVIYDFLPTGHMTRRMRMRSERFHLQKTPLYKTFTYKRPLIVNVRSPMEVV